MGEVGRFKPWKALRERPHILFRLDRAADDLGGGSFYGRIGDQAAIVISPRLDQAARGDALTHELIHDERRITYPGATAATMQREEVIVHRLTAVRRVPLDELEQLVDARAEVEPVTLAMVCEWFACGEEVATEAVRQLQARWLEAERVRSSKPVRRRVG